MNQRKRKWRLSLNAIMITIIIVYCVWLCFIFIYNAERLDVKEAPAVRELKMRLNKERGRIWVGTYIVDRNERDHKKRMVKHVISIKIDSPYMTDKEIGLLGHFKYLRSVRISNSSVTCGGAAELCDLLPDLSGVIFNYDQPYESDLDLNESKDESRIIKDYMEISVSDDYVEDNIRLGKKKGVRGCRYITKPFRTSTENTNQ